MSYNTTLKCIDQLGEDHDSLVKQWFENEPGQVKFIGDNIDIRTNVSCKVATILKHLEIGCC